MSEPRGRERRCPSPSTAKHRERAHENPGDPRQGIRESWTNRESRAAAWRCDPIRRQPIERLPQVSGGLPSFIRVLGQAARDDLIEKRRRDIVADSAASNRQRLRIAFEDAAITLACSGQRMPFAPSPSRTRGRRRQRCPTARQPLPSSCSGDIYGTVPTTVPSSVTVSCQSMAPFRGVGIEGPLREPEVQQLRSPRVSMTLAGFRSR